MHNPHSVQSNLDVTLAEEPPSARRMLWCSRSQERGAKYNWIPLMCALEIESKRWMKRLNPRTEIIARFGSLRIQRNHRTPRMHLFSWWELRLFKMKMLLCINHEWSLSGLESAVMKGPMENLFWADMRQLIIYAWLGEGRMWKLLVLNEQWFNCKLILVWNSHWH